VLRHEVALLVPAEREPEEISAPRLENLCEGDVARIAARKVRRFSRLGLLRRAA